MRFISLILGAVILLGAGCEENLDPSTAEGALNLLRDALLAKDSAAILAYSSQGTRDTLAQLHTLLGAQRVAIAEKYPEEHRAAAHRTYPAGVLEAKGAAELFTALIKPKLDALRADEGLRYGLTALGAPNLHGERASVPTQSGETVEFISEDGKWKTTVFEPALEQNLNKVRLSQQMLEQNLKVFEELRRRAAAEKAKAAGAGSGGAKP